MRQRVLLLLAVVLAACGSDQSMVPGRNVPQLVQEVTLAPTTPAPTRLLSPTPSPIVIPVTSEIISPLEIVTIEADFEVITPTLPPTKTMTPTPTITPTVTTTPIPSSTIPPTLTLPPSPSPVIVQAVIYPTAIVNQQPPPVQAPVSVIAVDCQSAWFFISNPLPTSCPSNASSSSEASYTQFQHGHMFWLGSQDAIYVLYDSAARPRWEVFQDTFEEGMTERDPAFSNNPAYTYQPGRGFGLIWRANSHVRDRIGWALSDWEFAFTANVQIGQDGTIFFDSPRGGVYALSPDGADWNLYDTF